MTRPDGGPARTAADTDDDRWLVRRTAVDTVRPFEDVTADWMLDRTAKDLPLYLLHVADHWESMPAGLLDALGDDTDGPRDGLAFSQYGLPALRQRLEQWLAHDEDWDPASAPMVSVSWSGTGAAIFDILRMLRDARSDPAAVLLPGPGWGYPNSVRATGFRPVAYEVPADSPTGPSPDHLERAVRQCRDEGLAIAAVLVNPQHNPWGGNWTPEFLAAVTGLSERERAPVILDNAFYGLTSEHVRPTSAMRLMARLVPQELLVSVRSLSKQFACSGWALGSVAGSPGLVTGYSGLRCLREPTSNFRAQAAMAAWLGGEESALFTRRRRAEATRHAELLRTTLRAAGLPDDAVLHHGGAPFTLLRPPPHRPAADTRAAVVQRSGALLGLDRDGRGQEWLKVWLGRESRVFTPAARALGAVAAELWSP